MHYSHRLSQARIHQIVGWFVIVPLLILGAVLFVVGKNENLFEEKYSVSTVFSEGYGLKPGHPVVLLGIQVGRVSEIEFTDQNDAKVTLKLLKKYQEKIRQNSVAKIGKTGGFIGEPQIEITVGNKSLPVVPEDGHIEAEDPFSIEEVLAEIQPLVETIKRTVGRFEQITEDVHATVMSGHEALKNVQEATAELPGVLDNVKQTTATVRDAAQSIAVELPAITTSARKSVNRVGELVEDLKATTSKLPPVVDDVKAMTGELKGFVHQDVPPLVRSAQGAVNDVNEILAGAKKTFPINIFAAKGRGTRTDEEGAVGNSVPRSLRKDDLVK